MQLVATPCRSWSAWLELAAVAIILLLLARQKTFHKTGDRNSGAPTRSLGEDTCKSDLHVAGHALSASLTDCTARRPLRVRPVPDTPGATPMRLRRMWNNFRALQGARMAASALVCAASLRKTRAGARPREQKNLAAGQLANTGLPRPSWRSVQPPHLLDAAQAKVRTGPP